MRMFAPSAAAVFLAVVTAAGAEESDLAAEVARLKAELAELKSKKCSAEPFSFYSAAQSAWSIGSNGVSDLLEHADLDDQLMAIVSSQYDKAKAAATGVADKLKSTDYTKLIQDLKTHPIYVDEIAPHLDTVMTAAKPHLEQHVYPALETASVQLEPMLKSAKETYGVAAKKVAEEYVPMLTRKSSQAFDVVADTPKHAEKAKSMLQKAMDPVFAALHRVAPKEAMNLPTSPVDRAILLIVCLFFLYHSLWPLSIAFRSSKFLVKLALRVVRLFVIKPVKLGFSVFYFFLWLFTCFGCCGLCCRRKKAKALAEKAGKENGTKAPNGDAKNDAKGAVKDATVAEIQQLLETAKKEDKLQAAAKQLVKYVKSGQAMSQPKHMANKKVTKDVCTKAFAKYKELDAKKLGL